MSTYLLETAVTTRIADRIAIRVLHVDDDDIFLNSAKGCMELEGDIQVEAARSADEALEKLKQEHFNVIVSDYQMPLKNGLDFLKELRAGGNKTPFILFTGKGREEIVVKALNLGAFRYVDKHGDPETVYGELSACIRQAYEHTQAQEKLHESEEWFRAIHDQQQTGIVVMDPATHRIVNTNPAAEEMIGAPKEKLIGKECHDCFCPAERGKCPVTDLGQTLNKSCRILVKMDENRTRIPILKAVKWVTISGRNYLVESFVDITEQKRAESALSESEEKFRATFESCREAIVIIDEAGSLNYANRAAHELFGCQKEQVGTFFFEKCLQQTSPEFLQKIKEASKDCKALVETLTGTTFEIAFHKPNNEETFVEVSLSAFKQNGKCNIVGFIREVTERKAQEKALMESRQKFMALFSENPESVVFSDKDFHIVDANPSYTKLFGHDLNDVKGKDAIETFAPDNLTEENKIIKRQLRNGHTECLTVRERKDGSQLHISLSGAPVVVNGNITGYVTVYNDISELVFANEEKSRLFDEQNKMLDKTNLLNEKLSVTGSLTRHDVRNKLAAIVAHTFMAKKRLQNTNVDALKHILQIEEVTKNIVRILDFAKTYEMLGNQERSDVEVGKMVDDAVSLFVDLKGVTVLNECNGFKVSADSLLMEVFHNFIDNSLKYGEKITRIRIHTEGNQDGGSDLVYEDNGVGIDPNVKSMLFKKGFGKGTGYGLYLIKRICEMYGWTIQEDGEFGKGVRFVMKIPPATGRLAECAS
ncbi:MAG: PAS domain S-box protein [Candidatus Bathyarchaeia archaeon]